MFARMGVMDACEILCMTIDEANAQRVSYGALFITYKQLKDMDLNKKQH
jgi:hypothetical protein